MYNVNKFVFNNLTYCVLFYKPLTANCRHTYCECCITRWLNKNQICPVCRSKIYTTNYSLVMDNFITNLCDLLGGSAKLQRDNIRNERSNLTSNSFSLINLIINVNVI